MSRLVSSSFRPRSPPGNASKRGLKRESGTRSMGLLQRVSSRQLVASQQHFLAAMPVHHPVRRLSFSNSSSSIMELDGSLQSMDLDTLDFLCREAAELLSPDSTTPLSSCYISPEQRKQQPETQKLPSDVPRLSTTVPTTQRQGYVEDNDDSPPEATEVSSSTSLEEEGHDEGIQMIEYQDGVFLPLFGCVATQRAILHGDVIVTKCVCCEENMTCIDHVDLAVCPDCWTYTPTRPDDDAEVEPVTRTSVGLGVKGDMLQALVASS